MPLHTSSFFGPERTEFCMYYHYYLHCLREIYIASSWKGTPFKNCMQEARMLLYGRSWPPALTPFSTAAFLLAGRFEEMVSSSRF